MNKTRLDSEEMKQAIMKAALDVANGGSWHDVTVRRVADEIGYAAPIIYQYFANKKAMLRAIAQDGFSQLADEIQQAAKDANEDSRERFRAIGSAYFTFAKQNFRVYQLMHESSFYRETDEPMVSANVLFEFMCKEVGTIAGRALSPQEAATRTFQAWATMHGLIMIEANCSFQHGWLKTEDVIKQFGEDFLHSIKTIKKV